MKSTKWRSLKLSRAAVNPHRYSLSSAARAAGLSLLLAGYAAAPPTPQLVDVPVCVSCMKTARIRPKYEFSSLTAADTDGDKYLALARDWQVGRAHEGELEAIIAGRK